VYPKIINAAFEFLFQSESNQISGNVVWFI
jgi:hypothetical protein